MKIKNFFYKYSIILFIGFVSFLIVSFPFQYTQDKMNNVSQPVRWLGALLFFLICFFIIRCKEQIGKIFDKKSLFVIMLALIVLLQLSTIFVFKIQPVNDLLYLHDESIPSERNKYMLVEELILHFMPIIFEKYQIIKFVDDSIFIKSVDILLDFLLLHPYSFLWNHDGFISIVCVYMERTR